MCISGLGTFTFSKRSIDVGSNKFIVIQRPVFVLSERFAQTHSLHYVKQHVSGGDSSTAYSNANTFSFVLHLCEYFSSIVCSSTGQIPILPMNFTILSNGTGLSREMVEGALKEVLQALSRSVAAKKTIEFDFGHIGRYMNIQV